MDCDVQGSPEAKKPCKGILKTSSSFDKHSVSQRRKSTKFDELNVMQTYHPADKDYGHMKIEEPKTPYNYANDDDQSLDKLDATELTERLQMTEPRRSIDEADDVDDSSEDECSFETEEERQRRLDFEKRRKLHYKEFEAVKLARKLIEEEDDDDGDGEESEGASSKPKTSAESAAYSNVCQASSSNSADVNTDQTCSSTMNEVEMEHENP